VRACRGFIFSLAAAPAVIRLMRVRLAGVEEGTALIIDFGSHVQRILTPSAKLSKL
jgi:hypothetical protein